MPPAFFEPLFEKRLSVSHWPKQVRWLSPDLRNRHVDVWLSPFAVQLKLSQHCLTGYTLI